MASLPRFLRWAAALLGLAAFVLPGLRLAAPPILPPRQWSGFDLVGDAVATVRAQPAPPEAYSALAPRLAFEAEIFHADTSAAPLGVMRVSGVFRIAPYIPIEVLLAALGAAFTVLLLAFRLEPWARLLAGVGTVCGASAVGLFAWLASAAQGQWQILAAREPALIAAAALHASVLSLGPGLYLPPLFLLAALALPGGER